MAPAQRGSNDRTVRCIVKLGGAAITHKNELESIDQAVLLQTAKQLRDALGLCCSKNLCMDWSSRGGVGDVKFPEEEDHLQAMNIPPFIVVHGAGSFGHFQARRGRVNLGGMESSFVKAGFVATRISVTTLNHQVVRAFASEGIPAVGISPFGGGWSTGGADAMNDMSFVLDQENSAYVKRVVDTGLLPVLHGDAVFDSIQGCRILSGDIIVRHLAHTLKPNYVVFLTNVSGVFDRPPSLPGAVLLKEIVVKDGNRSIIDPPLTGADAVKTSVAAHDTTGGMATKIAEAASIASAGIPVFIVKAGSPHAFEALKGTVTNSNENWVGTIIRPCEQERRHRSRHGTVMSPNLD